MSGGVDTTVVAAFAVGFVSFISPCVLPLVPGYLSAVSGVTVAEMQRGERANVLLPAIVFCLSFTVVFVALGMTATGLGSTLQDSRDTLDKIAGVVIIALGVLFVITPFVPAPEPRVAARRADQPRRLGRPAHRRRGVRVRVDAVRRPDARRDPHRRLGQGHRRRGRAAAGLLLGRPRGAVPAHRGRLHARDRRRSAGCATAGRIVTAISGVVLIVMGVLLLTGELTRLNVEAQHALDSLGLNVFKDL